MAQAEGQSQTLQKLHAGPEKDAPGAGITKKAEGLDQLGKDGVCLDPLVTAARILGTKNTKTSSGSTPAHAAPLLPGSVPGSSMKPVLRLQESSLPWSWFTEQ